MSLGAVLIIVLVLFLVFSVPFYPYNRDRWGYGPSGIIGVILLIFLVLLLTGNLHLGRL